MLYRGTPAGKVAEHTALEGFCSRWMLWRCPKELGEWSSWHHGGSPYRSQQISHLSHCFGKISVKRDVSRENFFWLVVWSQSPWWQDCVAGTHHTLMIQEADMEEETKQAGHRGLPCRALPSGSATSPDSTSRRPSVQTQEPSEDFSQSNFISPKEKLDL